MNQLCHTSKSVTERHYINRKLVVPDYRAATERLAPDSETSGGPSASERPRGPRTAPRPIPWTRSSFVNGDVLRAPTLVAAADAGGVP